MQEKKTDLVVLGGGPGGYSAAFRAADLGRKVTIIEKSSVLGGVCLNVGCIPSKTLLHLAEVIEEAEKLAPLGVSFGKPTFDLEKIRAHRDSVIHTLTSGLDSLYKARKIERIVGVGTFLSDTELMVVTDKEELKLTFEDLIIAVGSRSVQIPGIPYEDERIWDSTKALELTHIPKRLAIIGGGIIGLEVATMYHALGSKITIVEMMDSLIPPADRDLKQPLLKKLKKQYEAIYTSTKVEKVEAKKESLTLHLKGDNAPETIEADAVLVAVGRKANSDGIALENTTIKTNGRGWIEVDKKLRTNVSHVFAIGDVVGDPMLAHKSSHQGKVAAEVASGQASAFTPMGIPSVAYTSPEVAWVGLTETEAKEKGIAFKKGSFPWTANGRALSAVATDGVSKALYDEKTGRLLGAGICGKNAGELISEAVVALEMGAVSEDIALSIHPHPTLSETFAIAAELAEGTATDTLNR
ncbi:dihydrolipoyl dehydrogenase [Sphaerochaeta halotolerans]|jgi:dihydrolipoamide dehydrogenase|uniref:Dihydrolipoyl dehydrogenase n=1 Tax=Sphaerochaeta halotolerans TaxID=2293840 RepID=A0A372MET6_9SPIR|nr:dihydrolipoyl dehydrogenase [Sphaerochaeta halotolerans]MXI85930.1 dihydrolipoyl dehydrogenase [Sphaerochaeta halotolerans]RFU94297.1 dihydrolipoyl dehydrogenase [Sphaerochaeta halotolerans]